VRKYLVNTTYCIYMLDAQTLYYDQSIFTIKEVIEEVEHERGILIDIPLIKPKATIVTSHSKFLSSVDIMLLQTAKEMNYVVVSDDQKLISDAHKHNIDALDTPHFIHRLLIEKKWSEEQAIDILNKLKAYYNRTYVLDRVIKDIKNWR
jgi:rRNA-processing protein FCF1